MYKRQALDALRREEPFNGFCETLSALEQNSPEVVAALNTLRLAKDEAAAVKAADFAGQHLEGPAIGAAVLAAQTERVAAILKRFNQ